MARAFIGIGSNVEPEKNVKAAVRSLAQQTRLTGMSMVYRTNALGHPEQPDFYNCVVEIETDIPPQQVKHDLLRPIEDALGRNRTEDKYAPRTIDLDLIVYGDIAINTADLHLPDPEIMERPFLAVPLFELAPEMSLPGFNLRIHEIAARLPQSGMSPLEEYSTVLRNEFGCNPAAAVG
jgi:2-amino-4-hydroxy-6-hydroxymethyldihydropteridine diphosphokinase